ncbi:MAG TPA: glycogen/starch/alpha-glucan phosphorylase, partial [Candidatus Binataceae bacterium]|nr:glycogen/starch/alpha-glucan phosphorylase [Candidatus Binataceae bacterium]
MNSKEKAEPDYQDMSSNGSAESNAALFTRLIDHHIRFTAAKRRIQLSKHDWYRVTALAVRDMLVEKMLETRARFERSDAKKVFYLSVEYLIGRSLENNLFNLGIIDTCREFLGENGLDLNLLFDEEPDAGLGNGGLGRLAACFLDSLATLNLPGFAYGINYEFGLFRQEIRDGFQQERPDSWRREMSPWLIPRPEQSCIIPV